MLSTLLVILWGILTCISQYFIGWHTFAPTGLHVIGVIGFIGFVGFVLWLVSGYFRVYHTNTTPKWL